MRSLLASAFLLLPCHASDLETVKAIAAKSASFEEVALAKEGNVTALSIRLGDNPVQVGEEWYDGFRFKCPPVAGDQDFVWYFNVPESWANWYIVPAEGEPSPAFKNWLDADKLYAGLDKSGEKGRMRVLQTLTGGYFRPGAEYVMWFRKMGEGGDELRGVQKFATRGESWDHDAIEKALGLKDAPPEEQVAALGSRGGRILLDDRFFSRNYAAGRIRSALAGIRSVQRLKGGFFITTRTSVPVCETEPLLDEILKQHGPPDFVRDGREIQRMKSHRSGEEQTDDDEDTKLTGYHYDHFVFEVESAAKPAKVLRVSTVGSDFSDLRAPAAGSSFASLDLENLTVFHRDGKEVGRAYDFLEGGKEPLFVASPPTGEYRSEEDLLISKGGGTWIWDSLFPNGKLARRLPLERNRMHGKAEGFFFNGVPKFTAEYRDGRLHGEVVEFDENGKERARRKFEKGESVAP